MRYEKFGWQPVDTGFYRNWILSWEKLVSRKNFRSFWKKRINPRYFKERIMYFTVICFVIEPFCVFTFRWT